MIRKKRKQKWAVNDKNHQPPGYHQIKMKNGTTTTVTPTAPSSLSGIVVVQRDFRIPTPPRIYKTKQRPFVVLEVVLLVKISDPGVVVLD